MPKLNKRTVDALKPDPAKGTFTWDSELRGFGIRILPSGTRSYCIQYRNAEGRSRRLTLGSANVLRADEARELAREKLAAVRHGEDPAERRRALLTAPTVSEVCDWYLLEAEAGRLLGRRRRAVAMSTLALDRSRIETHVKPLLGRRVVRGLTIADLERFQADIAAGKTAKERTGRGGRTTGGGGVAGRTVGMLHTIFEQAARWNVIDANPARGVRKIEGDKKRERRLSADEIMALGNVLQSSPEESPVALDAIRLMLLTGFRKMEVLGLERQWVDHEGGYVRFPCTKTGPQIRPVGRPALDLIARQPMVNQSRFLFPGQAQNDHFVGIARVLTRLSISAGLQGVTPHVLRHTFASFAAELGYSELIVGALLGHAARGVTQRYVHLDKALKMAADEVAAAILARING